MKYYTEKKYKSGYVIVRATFTHRLNSKKLSWVKIIHLNSDPKTGEINLTRDRLIKLHKILTKLLQV